VLKKVFLALCCGIALTNLLRSVSKRPLIFSARFFEISLLVGCIDCFGAQFDGRVFDAASPAFSANLLEVAIAGFLLAVVIF
jgi:hypothetical protein